MSRYCANCAAIAPAVDRRIERERGKESGAILRRLDFPIGRGAIWTATFGALDFAQETSIAPPMRRTSIRPTWES